MSAGIPKELFKDFMEIDRPFLEEGTRACQHARDGPLAIDAPDPGSAAALDRLHKVLHLVDVTPGEALGPRPVYRRDKAMVAVGADHDRLPLHLPDLHDAFIAVDLDARVVPVSARADARDHAQAAALQMYIDEGVVIEVFR